MRNSVHFLCLSLLGAAAMPAADYRAGVASLVITPREPIYMSGYATRSHPSEGAIQDIKAKALVIEDRNKVQIAIVTADIIGYPRSLSDPVAARIQKSWGIDRAHLVLNASHTHTGPLIGDNLHTMFDLSPKDQAAVDRYAKKLADDLVALVGAAIGNLAPAELWFGNGQAHFAVNRRQPSPSGVQIGVNPSGPTDPDVPVLKVASPGGQVLALLFGYACHNTTLTGEFYKISGDYAGFAQADIEKASPGVTAMFLQLCGADQNPNPRSTLELAQKHGQELAAEVVRVAGSHMERVQGNTRAAYQVIDLPFAYHTREQFESRAQDKNVWVARNARAMLRAYDERRPVRSYPYPVQAIGFGKSLVLVTLGGEVVVDYCLRVKKEYGAKDIMVAGYSNDVMAYIPSHRVLKEGGYEADGSMVYYGQPGPWSDEVEDRIFGAIHKVMQRVGRKPL